MDQPWSRTAWRTVEPVFEQITTHPFLTGLMDGSLPRDKFLFYLEQDALYLNDFGKVLAGIAVRTPHREQVEAFLAFAGEIITAELGLHRSYLGQINPHAAPTPTCLLYTSFMHRQLAVTSLEVAVATVLPCFWIYKEVGDFILAGEQKIGNPYQSWIDTYGGDDFGQAVAKAIGMADDLAAKTTPETRAAMTATFELCTKMEWMFWDSGWKKEAWPV